MSVDTSRMHAKLAALARACGPASNNLLNGVAAGVARDLVTLAPKDTNRYIASLMQGFEQAEVPHAPRPALLRPSQYRALQRHVLGHQVNFMLGQLRSTRSGIVSLTRALKQCGYTSRGRPLDVQGHNWSRRLADLRSIEPVWVRLHQFAIDQLARFDSNEFAIVFGLGKSAIFGFRKTGESDYETTWLMPALRQALAKNGSIRWKGVTLEVTVRQGVNGGTGRRAVANGGPVIIIRSAEPHARILEGRRGIVRTALANSRSEGLRRMKPDFIVEISRTSGIAIGSAA